MKTAFQTQVKVKTMAFETQLRAKQGISDENWDFHVLGILG